MKAFPQLCRLLRELASTTSNQKEGAYVDRQTCAFASLSICHAEHSRRKSGLRQRNDSERSESHDGIAGVIGANGANGV